MSINTCITKIKSGNTSSRKEGVTTKNLGKERTFQEIPIESISYDSTINPRGVHSKEELESFKTSVAIFGVVTPIIVYVTKESLLSSKGNKYELYDGEKRVETSVSLGKSHIVAYVTKNKQEAEALRYELNLRQSSLHPIQKGRSYLGKVEHFKKSPNFLEMLKNYNESLSNEKILNENQYAVSQICLQEGISPTTYYRYVKYASIPVQILQFLKDNDIKTESLLSKIAKMSKQFNNGELEFQNEAEFSNSVIKSISTSGKIERSVKKSVGINTCQTSHFSNFKKQHPLLGVNHGKLYCRTQHLEMISSVEEIDDFEEGINEILYRLKKKRETILKGG